MIKRRASNSSNYFSLHELTEVFIGYIFSSCGSDAYYDFIPRFMVIGGGQFNIYNSVFDPGINILNSIPT